MLGKSKGRTRPAADDGAEETGGQPVAGGGTHAGKGATRGRPRAGVSVSALQTRAAQVLWLVCVAAALFLAVGALLVALGANESNALVAFVVSGAGVADLGIFSRAAGEGVFDFSGENAATKRTLVNWGIGAVAWLVVGKVAEKVVSP